MHEIPVTQKNSIHRDTKWEVNQLWWSMILFPFIGQTEAKIFETDTAVSLFQKDSQKMKDSKN